MTHDRLNPAHATTGSPQVVAADPQSTRFSQLAVRSFTRPGKCNPRPGLRLRFW
jgi:hypothetical protein